MIVKFKKNGNSLNIFFFTERGAVGTFKKKVYSAHRELSEMQMQIVITLKQIELRKRKKKTLCLAPHFPR